MDIPDDVSRIATGIVNTPLGATEDEYDFYLRIVKAILDERERCASVAANGFTASSVLKTARGKPYSTGEIAIWAGREIAHKIRSGK